MSRLEHANLVVKTIQPSLDFLLTAFPEWYIRGSGQGQWAGESRNWLHVGNDDYYLTLNDGAQGDNRDLAGLTPGLAHLGFVIDDVEALMARLQGKGYAVDIIGRDHPHRKTVYYIDPNGFQYEFIQYLTDDARLKNQYGGESGPLIRRKSIERNAVNTAVKGEGFIRDLYRQVDAKNIDYLAGILNSEINFCIGDNPVLQDKAAVLLANQGFFSSINSMEHQLDHIWQDGEHVGCYGQVNYVRLDGSKLSAKFSTTLKIENEKISDYYVFADLSKL